MCRLLGYATRTPTTLADLLGEADLHEFTQLSCKHGDGWGFAWADADGVAVDKAPDSARYSGAFAGAAHAHAADLALVHLRWATLGLGLTLENTHPFSDATIAFAHNGSISPPTALDALVPDEVAALRRGTTDSERYFLAVLAAARESGSEADAVADALAATVETIAGSIHFSGLNAMIATPRRLIAVCRFDPAAQAKESEPDYYQLGYRVTPDAVVVSSSGWGSGWTPLGNGELLVVERGSLEVTVGPLLRTRAA